MRQSITPSTGLCMLILCMAYLTACKKDTGDTPPPTDSTEKEFRINFSNATISLADVDSAEIVFTKAGSASITKKLGKANGYMFATPDDLSEGSWQAEWLVYTKKPAVGYGRQFSRLSSITIPLTEGKSELAPAGDWAGTWNPRVLANDPEANITYIVAMNFSDPYFSIINKGPKPFRYFLIDRMARNLHNGESHIAGAMKFERFINIPLAGVTDRRAFLPLAEDLQGKSWNEGQILVEVLDGSNLDRTFYFKYNS